jgi:hypothetical protein
MNIMKKIFTLFMSLMVGMAIFAAPVTGTAARPKSSVTIISANNADIIVEIDGRRFDPNDNSIKVNGLEAGTHRIRISRERERRGGGVYNMSGNKRYDVIFNNTITLKARTNLMISIDRSGRANFQETRKNNGRNDDWKEYDFNYGNGSYGDYDNHYGYESGMSDREFGRLMESISKEWLESNKIKSATHVVTTNSLTTAQVKQLVLLFGFESNKLELAKQAYANTVDKRNYYMLNDVFSFNSSKDELARFIRNFR